ncbi:sugar kinase [Rehaibacterium terrae]|jgi:2-dehydro-3-deoxygluconokinase|uniref:2-dehydro-3-deoxygluconokinase n=1 Tax=Rehaibacterium terrae TaxID=1341696 RepID=A0A7W7V967_9GAMM|nr:sugar kinase [Rehaibacterium terrae]MBB5014749.1 2-dehydro-3-deoxygluconokinase [Rehaibacterium terrae]
MPHRIVCLGELLLRLGAPDRQLLLQTPQFEVHVGGAEANVAVSLARFGHTAAMVSVVPDNALGAAAVGELRRHGVDTGAVVTGPGRMGLYFLATGAIQRPSEVLYDRAHSAFALAAPERFDWDALLTGADAFHLSGVTPALGPGPAAAAQRAIHAARARGLNVSFDGNFRPKLWDAWRGDAPAILRTLMGEADLLFADHRDIAVALGAEFPQVTPAERVIAAAQAAFAAFPALGRLATTIREQHSVDHHTLSALMVTRDGAVHATPAYPLTPIVDRIGAGDAFAAGVLHGRFAGLDDAACLHFGLAAACLKHSLPGDFNLVDVDDVAAFLAQGRFDVRR